MLIPPPLRPGDTVAIVAPASPFPYADLDNAFRILRTEWGLNVLEGTYLGATAGPFAGTDAQRTADLQTAIDNPDIRAIFTARGGYGAYRIVDKLDFSALQTNPKWLIGYSDITVLLAHLEQQGLASLHAIMLRQFRLDSVTDDIETLRQWLFGENVAPYTAPFSLLNRPGTATGTLVGGNLSLLVHTLGTSSEGDWAGKLLFLEDIGETLFSLDRMLTQLRRAGKLAHLAGLLVGTFSDMVDNATMPYGVSANEIIADAVSDYAYPVVFGMPIGHEGRNLAMPVGVAGTLHVGPEGGVVSF